MPIPGEDSMNKLSKEKRNQLVLVVLVTGGLLAGLWLGLIRYQQQSLGVLAQSKIASEQKLEQVKEAIESADQIESQLAEARQRLSKIEATMASGDLYAWAINTLRQFKLGYRVDIPQFSQIDGPKDMNMLAGFPYKQATMTISGTAFYTDFGKFIADFENQFPYMRVMNLSLEPVPALVGSDKEKLAFRMEIAALVKANPS
jgi:Tfp pilus assembly protein PilO